MYIDLTFSFSLPVTGEFEIGKWTDLLYHDEFGHLHANNQVLYWP